MHDERVVDYFRFHRCFVTYDGFDTSMISYSTFLQHLADALFIPSVITLSTILATLRASPTLLVIDNAETFLDVDTVEGGYISEAIADLGGCRSVHLILTTRSANLPNLPWVRQDVGGLDAEASRRLFCTVYDKDIDNRLDSLFSSLDHNALSIALLSHVAVQKGYKTTDEIKEAWKLQQTRLSKTGVMPTRKLGATIEMSINLPFLQAHKKPMVLDFLRLVAFFPEGIHREDILGLFPNSMNIKRLVDAVCRSSLTYESEERLTMLAPIRMYIMDQYNINLAYTTPFLVSVRDYFNRQLHDHPESWGVRESANVERLLSFDLTSHHVQRDVTSRLRTLKSVGDLCHALFSYHPHETSLFPLIKSALEKGPRFRVAGVSVGKQSSKRLVLAKAECLVDICWLRYKLRREFIKNDMLGTAESYCRSHTPTCSEPLASCLRLKGLKYQEDGNLFLVDEALREASTLARSLSNHLTEALLNYDLSGVLFLRGNISEATSLISSVEAYFRSNNQHVHLVNLLVQRINVLLYEKDFGSAREILGQAEELDRGRNGGRGSRALLNWKASIEGWAGNIAAAIKVVEEATRDNMHSGMLGFNEYVMSWRAMAYYAAAVGSFDDAREFLARAIDLASGADYRSRRDTLLAAYIQLYSLELDGAKQLLEDALAQDSEDQMQFTGFIYRALGEVALLQGDTEQAVIHFAEVKSICEASGIAPKLLYGNCYHYYTLAAKYDGWSRFLDETL